MAGIFTKAKKQKLPPVQQAAPPPEVTEDVGDEEARRIRKRGRRGFLGTLRVGELSSDTGKKTFLG